MAQAEAVTITPTPTPTPLHVDGVVFPAFVTAPGSSQPPLFLAGAGVRGMQIAGKFIKFTAIGVYLDKSAIDALSAKWAGKTPDELAATTDFYTDIIYGPFEKFTRVTMILPLTGEQYSDKVSENCEAQWKAAGILTDAELDALSKFKQAFKPETFPPGASILFTHSASGALSIAFTKDESMPETNTAVVENKALCYGTLESIIGEHGVSPEAKRSLAVRMCELLKPPSTTNKQEEEVGASAVAINA